MKTPPKIQRIALANGGRILRIEDEATGLSVERKLDPAKPLVAHQTKLARLFEALLLSEPAPA